MIWQDFVFLVGSLTSVMFLYPTLRDAASQVPRATSIPSMIIGAVYSMTFFTLGMEFSAFGSFAACTMWSLIAAFRGPDGSSLREELSLAAVRDQIDGVRRRVTGTGTLQAEPVDDDFDVAPHSD